MAVTWSGHVSHQGGGRVWPKGGLTKRGIWPSWGGSSLVGSAWRGWSARRGGFSPVGTSQQRAASGLKTSTSGGLCWDTTKLLVDNWSQRWEETNIKDKFSALTVITSSEWSSKSCSWSKDWDNASGFISLTRYKQGSSGALKKDDFLPQTRFIHVISAAGAAQFATPWWNHKVTETVIWLPFDCKMFLQFTHQRFCSSLMKMQRWTSRSAFQNEYDVGPAQVRLWSLQALEFFQLEVDHVFTSTRFYWCWRFEIHWKEKVVTEEQTSQQGSSFVPHIRVLRIVNWPSIDLCRGATQFPTFRESSTTKW